jgi:hypothetical protein
MGATTMLSFWIMSGTLMLLYEQRRPRIYLD